VATSTAQAFGRLAVLSRCYNKLGFFVELLRQSKQALGRLRAAARASSAKLASVLTAHAMLIPIGVEGSRI
jgi:hypothetical protein